MTPESQGDLNRRSLLRGIGAVSTLSFAGIATADTGRQRGPKPDELVVGIGAGASTAAVQRRVGQQLPDGARVVHRNEVLGYLAVRVPDEAQAQADSAMAQRLQSTSGVDYVEENATYHTQLQPDDPQFGSQYAPQQVNAPDAWDTTLGSENVTVAVVDTGADYSHEDLQAQYGSDKGYDFVDSDTDPMPSSAQHGTHVSGIASGTTDNGIGVAGMSNSRLLSVRALGGGGSGSLTDIADGVQWAADQGADIINMSLGGGGYTQTMKDAVSYAVNNGTLPICAAGNNGSRGVSYPAKYEECVAVSALNSNENLASFSQYGPNIDVAAPGVDVLSTVPGDSYARLSGTSMACPAASGVAALGLAVNPGLGPQELRQKLKSTAVDVGLSDEEQGAGRVDAANIVAGGGGGNSPPTASASASATNVDVGETVTFDGSGSTDSDGSITAYEWTFGDGATATGATVSHSYGASGTYTATLTVTDDAGATDSDSVEINVGDGGGGGDNAPVIETHQFSSSCGYYACDYTVDLVLSDQDGDLAGVESQLIDTNGRVIDSASASLSGSSASGSLTLNGSAYYQPDRIVTTVVDSKGNTDTATIN